MNKVYLNLESTGEVNFQYCTVELVFVPPSVQALPAEGQDYIMSIGNNTQLNFNGCTVQLVSGDGQDIMNLCGQNYGKFEFNLCTMKPVSMELPSADQNIKMNLRAGNSGKFCFNNCTIQPVTMQWPHSAQVHPSDLPSSPHTLSLPSLEDVSPDNRSQRSFEMPTSMPK